MGNSTRPTSPSSARETPSKLKILVVYLPAYKVRVTPIHRSYVVWLHSSL